MYSLWISYLYRFPASFATLAELTNDEQTRTFLTLEVGAGHLEASSLFDIQYTPQFNVDHSQFKTLCDAVTPILRKYRQKEFYSEPRFHASIAWALLANAAHKQLDSQSPSTDVADDGPAIHDMEDKGKSKVVSTEYPTIPRFPPDLVSTLEAEFGSMLRSRHVGTFECEHLCVRIGKEVMRWMLAG